MSGAGNLHAIEPALLGNVLRKTVRLMNRLPEEATAATEDLTEADLESTTLRAPATAASELPISLLDHASAMLFVASHDGAIRYCNDFFLSYAGFSPSNAARSTVIDLIHPDDRRAVATISARAAEARTTFSLSCRLRSQSGGYKPFHFRITPIERDETTWWYGAGIEIEEHGHATRLTFPGHDELKEVLDNISDCYLALDQQQRVTAMNRSAELWLGMSPETLIGQNLGSIAEFGALVADSAQAQLSTLKALQRMVQDAIEHGVQGRKQIHSAMHSDRWIDVQVIPASEGALVIFKDITNQKFDQIRVTRSQGLIQSSLDSLPGRIAILDADGVIIAVNKAWRAFQQPVDDVSRGAVVGANYRNHCETSEVRRGLAAAIGGRDAFKGSYELDLPTGHRCYQVTITTFEQSEFQRIVVSHEDVTELVSSRQSVADLHAQLCCLQENERQRIALELHDSTAQYLVAAGLNLIRLKELVVEEEAHSICDEVDDLLSDALKELRTFTYLLHPIGLSDEGLVVTLHRFALGLGKRALLEIDLSLDDGIDQLPFDFQRTVLRIAQEALANAHRHANATRIDLSVTMSDREVSLRVSDNGRGMPQATWGDPEKLTGVGIAGMRTRVAQFGGTIDFPTGPTGTTVVARIPVPECADLVPTQVEVSDTIYWGRILAFNGEENSL